MPTAGRFNAGVRLNIIPDRATLVGTLRSFDPEVRRDVIARFGRFPHRNAALGRTSTPEEQAWLDAGGGF